MAKTATQNQSTACMLIINPEEFKKELENRIRLGKDLLNASIKAITFVRGYEQYTDYDEEAKKLFFSKYDRWNKYNVDFLKLKAFNLPENDYQKEYENAFYLPAIYGSNDVVKGKKETIRLKVDKLESFVERLPLIPCAVSVQENIVDTIDSSQFGNDVFIVHGHDEAMKATTARVLTMLGLNPIILHEQPNHGQTIIEKFESKGSNVGFAIILLTADDLGKAQKEEESHPRARQNVVFEMGYFIGKLGRKRVFLLLESGVEKPGDLDGMVYTLIDSHNGWQLDLVKELKACGYNVDANMLFR